MLSRLTFLFVLGALSGQLARAQTFAPVAQDQIYSRHFVVTVDGQPVQVMHAALNLYFVNLVAGPRHRITVEAPTETFWAGGVEVQPWRRNIRPRIRGKEASFELDGVAQITLSRPNDFASTSEMLYVFANPPETNPPSVTTDTVRFYPPGVYRTNIDAHSGDTIYLAPGAVIFGSLNVWKAEHVKVFGRGVIVYDGPQNPADDDGWMHKPNWHCIVMDNAHDVSIEGLTCVVRSRTWQIQMTDSRRIVYDNVKVIGANAGNANADGMDWLGGGDTVVRNSFFRAADDVFAMQTSWNGYTDEALAAQGHPVNHILIENVVVSTSISNIVRAAWPKKNFEGGDFTMRDSDVLHMGPGGCGVPFALLGMWADPDGRGNSSGFHFENIRLEDWYTLFQLLQPAPGISDVTFTDMMAPEQPALVPSAVKGSVSGVKLDNVIAAGTPALRGAGLPIEVLDGAEAPVLGNSAPIVRLRPVTGLVKPHQKVHFQAELGAGPHVALRYTWYFGDGAKATGPKATHRFPDTAGTLQDGSGRFRVLLQVSSAAGRTVWLYQPVVVSYALLPAVAPTSAEQALRLAEVSHAAANYDVTLEGDVQAPMDGAYTFLLVANEAAEITLDGRLTAHAPAPLAQVCGLAGDAARAIPLSAALARGTHHLKVTEHHGTGNDDVQILWQGPGFAMQSVQPAPGVLPANAGGGARAGSK